MQGHCSTGQSPERVVVPMEEEEYRDAGSTEHKETLKH
jgi:hypothetical protein